MKLTSWSLDSSYQIIKMVTRVSKINYTDNERKFISDIGNRIVELRRKKGISQEMLADQMKIAPRSLSDIENGKCSPNSIMIYRIAAVLGIPMPIV